MEEDFYIQKLLQMPKKFEEFYRHNQYAQAKYQYDTAIRVADFLGAPEEIRNKLFGNRQDENNLIEGLFPEDHVQKCYYECAVKRNMGDENIAYRRPK